MKLTDPSDDELNAAFFTKIARKTMSTVLELPDYVNHIEQVLPVIERKEWPRLSCAIEYHECTGIWSVRILPIPEDGDMEGVDSEHGMDRKLAKALMLAALRVHGVEIEITQSPNQ